MNFDALQADLKAEFQQYPVLFAYVYGSQATGRTHQESDIDFGVFFNKTLSTDERPAMQLELLNALSRICRTDDIDLVILNECPPLLAYEVLRNGLPVYCSDEDARIEFQVRTLQAYEDTMPLRKVLSEAMAERIRKGDFGKLLMKRVG